MPADEFTEGLGITVDMPTEQHPVGRGEVGIAVLAGWCGAHTGHGVPRLRKFELRIS
jgi:hypothetical protein